MHNRLPQQADPTPATNGRRNPSAPASSARSDSAASPNWRERAADLVIRHPVVSFGAAVVTGIALGWLLKRR